MPLRIGKILRIAFAFGLSGFAGHLIWSAAKRRLSWPELGVSAVGVLALGAFALFCWPSWWQKTNRSLGDGLLALFLGIFGCGGLD